MKPNQTKQFKLNKQNESVKINSSFKSRLFGDTYKRRVSSSQNVINFQTTWLGEDIRIHSHIGISSIS